ncbi:complement resistance protein TraT [Dongshaea marina]|uniref:complement resistance protein TraT n=1 Tax=Dongshaea marina TaxID=2047966 RepID=UPI00131EF905|nr:complement resistance protein TraT [Dongshaea marina]
MGKIIRLPIIFFIAFAAVGCSAIGTAVSHHRLETETLMSNSMFLSPDANQVPPTIFVMITNTSAYPKFKIDSSLINKLKEKGYQITSNSRRASYVLQVNILQVGRNSETAAKEMMSSGYGGSLQGIASGVAIAAEGGGDIVIGGLAGGVSTTVADNFIKNVTYSVISDVKLVQNFNNEPSITNKTRVLSTANKVNLDFYSSQESLETGLVNSLSGIFINRNSCKE